MEHIDILQEIVARKREEVARLRGGTDLAAMRVACHASAPCKSLRAGLLASPSGIIAEFKRRSPSRGWINAGADAAAVARAYAGAGAAALSVLTDEGFFGGSLADLKAARGAVELPLLCKDFVIDEVQLLRARLAGADAVLLIAAALPLRDCIRLARQAHGLGLEVLLEIHGEDELAYLAAEPDVVGVNNRHLGTFHTDVGCSFRLAGRLPAGQTCVSESGLHDAATVRRLRAVGYRGFLIGSHFMETAAPADGLAQLLAAL